MRAKIVLLFSCLFLSLNAQAAGEKLQWVALQWVALYNSELVEWLENENQLTALCPKNLPADKMQVCKEEKLRDKKLEIAVFDSAEGKDKTGTIIVTASPGKGLSAVFRKGDSSEAVSFELDLFDADWGYGPYFHQTVIDQKKEWVLLPAKPMLQPGWINLKDLKEQSDPLLKPVELGTVYELGDQSIIITKFTDSGVMARSEQPADMWCREGDPPALIPNQAKEIKYNDLFDQNRHLKLKLKYSRGC